MKFIIMKTTIFTLIALLTFTFSFAQNTGKTQNEQTEKTTNNVSTWKSNVQAQKLIPIDNIDSHSNIQKTSSTIKEVKVANSEEYYHPETNKFKLANSSESIEIIEKRDAQSRTFLNTDGSFTKVQTNSYFHYKKDVNGNWISFDGTLTQNQKNSNVYEVAKTDLPITIDLSTGKTMMAMEKNQYIGFGNNVNLIVMDKNFNEVNRLADNKSKNNSIKEKEILIKNSWANIDRQQEVDYWYAKSDYVINSKPNYNNTDGYLLFEDKIELPTGWQIIKSNEGEETVTGWQGDLIIMNSSGKEVGRFHTPIYYESSVNGSTEKNSCSATKKESDVQNNNSTEKNRAIIGSYSLKESGGKYTLSVVVPLSWLLSADRIYPVTIDPTASNIYASGNIASCYYPTFNSINMDVTIPAGSTVTATNSQCTYIAVSPTWRSDGWIGFQSGSNLDGYWYCNVNSPGTCNVIGTSNSTIANGTYSSGTVPFTLKVSRDYPSGSCNTTYLYVNNSTWTETVTYTTPCTAPGVLTLVSPANNANVQPGKTVHFTWNAPTSGTTPFTYTFYFYNGSSWTNWSAGSNTYFDLQLSEYNSSTWCGTSAQWYVKATNSCGNTNSATRNLISYPKYSGSTADYTITPSNSCQTSGSHSIVQGGANYYSFNAVTGNTYYFSTCANELGCGTNTGWDTYLKIYGTDGNCTISAYNDDGGSCNNYESYINGWTCNISGTYYLQITGYNSSAYGTYYLEYKHCVPAGSPTLTFPANNANIQPGKVTHYTWNAPTTGSGPFIYTFYFYNGSSWSNWNCDTNRYIDLQLLEYNSASWCGTNAQWYVKGTNSCGNDSSATRNLIPYPKYSGSTADYTITPTSSCQSGGAHYIIQGGADYYSFNATAGSTYYFSTCSTDLGCGTSTGWDTYLKIYGTDGSCTTSAFNDDGGACTNNESFINGWTCSTTDTYYVQITGYNSLAYGKCYLQYKETCPTLTANLTGGSLPICYNTAPDIFTATGSGGSGTYTYLWYLNGSSTGITTQTYTAPALTANATIYCALSSCGQTANTSTINITVNPSPIANAGPDKIISVGQNTLIGSSIIPGNIYSWIPVNGLNNSNISNPIANPNITTDYTLTVQNSFGCFAFDTVTVTVSNNISIDTNFAWCGYSPKYAIYYNKQAVRDSLDSIYNSKRTTYPCTQHFSLSYDDDVLGVGFEDPILGQQRRDCACSVFQYIESLIDINLPVGETINIEFLPSGPINGNPNALAAAAPYWNPDFNNGVPGIYGGNVYEHITTGYDPDPTNNFDGHVQVNFNFIYANCNLPVGNCQYDLYSILLHEVGHALGLLSLVQENSGSYLPETWNGLNQFTQYDWQFLYRGDINNPISFQKLINPPLNNPSINGAFGINSLRDGMIWTHNTGRFLNNQPVYSGTSIPEYYTFLVNSGSLVSHLDGHYLAFNFRGCLSPGYLPHYLMSPFFNEGETRREITIPEIRLLMEMGYHLNPIFAASTTYNGTDLDGDIVNINRPPYTTKQTTSQNVPAANDFHYPDLVQPFDLQIVNDGLPHDFDLGIDPTIIDPDLDAVRVEDNTLFNIRGCGNGNNHNQLLLGTGISGVPNSLITFAPRPDFIGRAQFGFYLHDGKERGSFMIYTIDVVSGSSFVNTNNPNTPIGANEFVVNGACEQGTEVKTFPLNEFGPYSSQDLGKGGREGEYYVGVTFSDAHPLLYTNLPWTSSHGNLVIRNSRKECNTGTYSTAFGTNPFDFHVPLLSPWFNPAPNGNNGDRYQLLMGSYNYFTLADPVTSCTNNTNVPYLLTFDINLDNVGLPVGSIYNLIIGFTSQATHPNIVYNFSLPTQAINVTGGWQTVQIPFYYCSADASNFLNFEGNYQRAYIDNVSLTLGEPLALAVNAGQDQEICAGSNVTLNPVVNIQKCNYSYNWSPATGLNCTNCQNPIATPAVTTVYSVTVTDIFGCEVVSDNVTVTVNPLPTPVITGSLSYCTGSSTTLDAGAGYTTYYWSTGAATQTINATTANNPITVTVTDANNCTATSTVTITEYLLNATTTQTDLTCNSVNTGAIDLTVTNGTSPYTYSWTGPGTFTANTEDIANLALGTYDVTVTDANSCTWAGNATVIEDILNTNWPMVIPNTSGDEQIYDMTIDAQGNIYAIGLFNDNITLPDINNNLITYTSTYPDASIFVAKYDYCGNCINGHVYGSIASTVADPYECHIEYMQSADKIAVTGPFTSVDFTYPLFDGDEMTASSGGIFLAFLDPTTLYCTTTQEVSLISTQAVYVKGLSLNGNSAFITGIFSDHLLTVTPSGVTRDNTNAQVCCPHSDIFMARFDLISNDLQFVWCNSYTQSISNDQGMATEWVTSDIYFTYKRDQESFIVKIDASDGSWVLNSEEKIGAGSEYFEINDMTSYSGILYLCGFKLTTSKQAAVISYPNLPNINWNPTDAISVISTPPSGNDKNTANKIVVNSDGVYVAGTFGQNGFSFNPGMDPYYELNLSGNVVANHFVIKFDASLGWLWQTGVMSNTIGTSRATSLVYDSDRDMYYIGGSFNGTVTLVSSANHFIGPSVNNSNDAFIARFEDIGIGANYKHLFAINDSLNKRENTDIILYPNPSNGKLIVKSENDKEAITGIIITDMTGRVVYEKNINVLTFEIENNLSFLSANTYIVKINTNSNSYKRFFVVVK